MAERRNQQPAQQATDTDTGLSDADREAVASAQSAMSGGVPTVEQVQAIPDVRDPEPPLTQQRPVDPNLPGAPPGGVTTMQGLFGQPTVVDEVQEHPLQPPTASEFWVIRPNENVEDMTVGDVNYHFAFQAGVRYKVPQRVAEILADRDKLMEVPFPYDERFAAARR
jgi:hypothetical protein